MDTNRLTFTYRNWRGEVAARHIGPSSAIFRFDATEWHPEPQWLLCAFDLEKDEWRDFAVKDILHFGAAAPAPLPADGVREALEEALALLQEHKHGSPARSFGHNAQHEIKKALVLLDAPPLGEGEKGEAVACERCQGNGEIVTDWERYRHPRDSDVGDEAVAECSDCSGQGEIEAAPPSPEVEKLAADVEFWKERFQAETRARIEAEELRSQIVSTLEEWGHGPVKGGKMAQIAYAKAAKLVRSGLARAASREDAAR